MPGNHASVKFEKKLIERDREFGFLICRRVFFCVQGASTERSGSCS
jgi:hypothetical protein